MLVRATALLVISTEGKYNPVLGASVHFIAARAGG